MKYELVFILLLVSISLISCSTIDNAVSKYGKNDTTVTSNCIQPENNCPICEIHDLEQIGFFTGDKSEMQFYEFLDSSTKFLHCEMIVIENKKLGDKLIFLEDNRVDVNLILNVNQTTNLVNSVLMPKIKSQYNNLFANGVDIKLKTDVNSNYCLNEYGVFVFETKTDTAKIFKYSMYFKSNSTSKLYQNYFDTRWN